VQQPKLRFIGVELYFDDLETAGCAILSRPSRKGGDIQYHLYVLDKVRGGLDDTRLRGAICQEEAEKRRSKRLIE